MVDTALITRLKKVQALTESSNPNEAAAAAEKLQELLLKYNIELADVSGPVSDGRPSRVYGKFDLTVPASGYRRTLMNALANNNLCRFVYRPGGQTAWLIGEQHNVAAVQWMFEHIDKQLELLVWHGYLEYKKECRLFGYQPAPARTWKTDFRIGAVHTINRRLEEQRKRMQADDAAVNALVVVNDSALKDATKNYFPNLVTGARRHGGTTSGYTYGKEAGEKVTFEAQLKKGG